jgi:hypothetical protein
MTDEQTRQLNMRLTEDEWKEIDEMAHKLGLDKKELILRGVESLKEKPVKHGLTATWVKRSRLA